MPLRIQVHISEEGPPSVVAQAYWLRKGSTAKIGFLVDTGAFDISLSEDDLHFAAEAFGRSIRAVTR